MAGIRYWIMIEAGTLTSAQVLSAHQDRAKTCQSLINLISGIDAGNWRAGRVEIQQGYGFGGAAVPASQTITYSGSSGAQTISVKTQLFQALGILTIASGSGAVGGTIGGIAKTVTWGTSDAATSDALAAAINADATLSQWVTAYSRVASQTVVISSGAGPQTISLGGISTTVTWGTSDTATAAALAAAININALIPGVVATSSAGTITCWAEVAGAGSNAITVTATGTGMTATGATLTGGGTNANVLISADGPGPAGNGITLAASGTGVATPTGANFVGGSYSPAVTVSFAAGTTDAATVQNAIAAIRASPAMLGLVFVPTPPSYGAAINTGSVLTLWTNVSPLANTIGSAISLFATGTGATVGGPSPAFIAGVNATPNGFYL